MQITEIHFADVVPIEGYGPDFFRVGGEVLHGAVLVRREKAVSWGGMDARDTLLALAGDIDVLLVGTGAEMRPLPRDLRIALEEAGIGVEVMASANAARTYNVLLAEDRRVAAALLPAGGAGA